MSGIDPALLPTVQHDPSIKVLEMPQLGYHGIAINIGNRNGVGNLPYTNVGTPLAESAKLRRAFEEALDRATFVKVVQGGVGEPGCTPIAPGSPVYDPSIKCTPYNPNDARKLVAQSGFPNPTVHLLTGTGDQQARVAQFIQAQEAAVGINVMIDSFDGATGAAMMSGGNFDTVLVSPAGTSDTDRNLYPVFATTGPQNFSGYSNPSVDLMLANARNATSLSALKTLYDTAELQILNDRPVIILYHAVKLFGVSTSVAGVQAYPDLVAHVAFAQYK
jgi:peptide/nickel transport system substrate-binding protein